MERWGDSRHDRDELDRWLTREDELSSDGAESENELAETERGESEKLW